MLLHNICCTFGAHALVTHSWIRLIGGVSVPLFRLKFRPDNF
jgi:hypothetical protein